MIIGIDIRVLGNNVKSGIEEYTENLLAHMLRLGRDIKFKLFFSSFRGKLKDYDWLHLRNVESYDFKIPNRLLFLSSSFLYWPKVDELIGGADVFFSPHFFITALSPGCKRVTTFHDLSYIYYPEFFSRRQNIWHSIEMNPLWQSRFSDKIIAVSESTKNDLVGLYKVDPAKVEVIYSGISSEIRRPSDEEILKFKLTNKLPQKFILFLGKFEPRKNIVSIIKAFDIIKSYETFNDLHLVIAGSRGWLYQDIFKNINISKYKHQIAVRDYISDDDRRFYYSLASVFIYPSFFEGFGFPPLEAMACGTPVIVSNASSMPEIVRNKGITVQATNTADLARAIREILTDNELRHHFTGRVLEHSKLFNWQKTAEKTLDCILSSAYKI